MHPQAKNDPAQAAGQRVRLLLGSGIQPALSGAVKAAGLGTL